MTRIHCFLPVIILAITAFHADTLFGRGGGGFHGGGGGGHIGGGNLGGGNLGGARPGGNFGGGNLSGLNRPGGGSFGGGNLSGLNRPGGGNLGGGNFGGGNFGGGNLGGGDFGGGHSGGPGLGQFDLGSKGGGGGKSDGPGLGDFSLGSKGGGGGLDGKGFPGNSSKGFTGKGSGNGNPFGGKSGEGPNKNQLGNFLGLPSDSGMNSLTKNTHLNNTHLNNTHLNNTHINNTTNNLVRINNTQLNNRANYTRNDFRRNGYNSYYSNNWYRKYPNAWHTNRWAYGNIWTVASVPYVNSWFGYGNTQPIYYDYGNNVTYQDNSVYVNGQDVGTSQQYYQQAQTVASTGAEAQTNDDEKWMPLGVFAMTHDQQNKANLILQLAVNKQGVIRGNYSATLTKDNQPVQGSVDKKTQKAAWTIGKDTENVFETGIYNLTKDEAPMLVHLGADKTEQWMLVRQKEDAKDGQDSSKD